MKHDIHAATCCDRCKFSRQDFNGSNILGITCDFLGINRQLIPVSCEYRSALQFLV